ncbi:MAG: BolA/IbaG family iron-sulfur metabolism protein [Deltaproteobacteria bacterium]|nr:BolA/IbaG family iron-sulfur metabolism protein [Deltaproteobacteria bacterium]
MKAHDIKARIETIAPGTKAELIDLTGTQDHWQAIIISSAFAGKTLLEQHRLIFGLFKAEVDSNEMHALTLKTYTPEQYERMNHAR